jgi:hypothetical protein
MYADENEFVDGIDEAPDDWEEQAYEDEERDRRETEVREMEKRKRECVREGVEPRDAESDVTVSAAAQAAAVRALDLKQSQLAAAEIFGQKQESFSTRELASRDDFEAFAADIAEYFWRYRDQEHFEMAFKTAFAHLPKMLNKKGLDELSATCSVAGKLRSDNIKMKQKTAHNDAKAIPQRGGLNLDVTDRGGAFTEAEETPW